MSKLSAKSIDQIISSFPQLDFVHNFPLSEITYFKIGGPAKLLVEVSNLSLLIKLITFCRKNEIEFVILGGASNVVVADAGLEKLVILARHQEVQLLKDDKYSTESRHILLVESGIKTADLVNQSMKLGLTGLEPFFGVPGRLGGAIYNNSHFQTELIGDYIYRVQVLTKDNKIEWITKEECQFDYDHSRFQSTGEVILQAELKLATGEKEKSKQIIRDSMMYRSKTQPLHLPSSGCIFKNVENNIILQDMFPQFVQKSHVSAGFLIDQAGLKGMREGDIEVSPVHASFMVNHGQGKASDVKKLVEIVKNTVKDKFEVELKEEIFWLS